MRTGLKAWCWCAALLLAGCLEVESQEARVVSDPAHDRIDVMIVSRGVASSAEGDNLAKDLADLKKCRDVAALPIPGFGVADFAAPADGEKDAKWQRSVKFLQIEAGAFFVDEQGRLSYYQFLRIEPASAFCRMVDEALQQQWGEQQGRSGKLAGAALDAAVAAAVKSGHLGFRMDGAGFSYREPMDDDEHRARQDSQWRSVVRDVEKALGKDGDKTDATQRGIVQLLRDNDIAAVRRVGYTEYFAGTQGAPECDYQYRGPKYRDSLLQALVADEPRPPNATQALIEKQFAAFRQREPRMPPAFAAARQRALEQGR